MPEKKRKTTRLKELYLRQGVPLIAISSPTPHAAKILEALGHEYTFMAGGVTGSAMLGMPDTGTISLTEFVWMSQLVADAVDIPVDADADTCFGGILHVERAVKELIRAGIAGVRIEDQPFIGKRFGGMVGKEVIPLGEAVAKFRVAVDTRNELDEDFQIIARCEALTASNSAGLPEAIERLQAYKSAGVDVLHLEGPRSIDEIRAVREAVEGPLTCNFYNMPEDLTPEQAMELGLCESRYPGLISGAMHAAAWEVLARFRAEGYQGVRDFRSMFSPHSESQRLDVSGVGHLREMEERYLPTQMLEKYNIPTPEGRGIRS
jgi:2-methylisocitrate lyase-like PEP mutase family enzyme